VRFDRHDTKHTFPRIARLQAARQGIGRSKSTIYLPNIIVHRRNPCRTEFYNTSRRLLFIYICIYCVKILYCLYLPILCSTRERTADSANPPASRCCGCAGNQFWSVRRAFSRRTEYDMISFGKSKKTSTKQSHIQQRAIRRCLMKL